MAATLIFKRLICLPKLCRSIHEPLPGITTYPDIDISKLPERSRYWSYTTLNVKKSDSLNCDIIRLYNRGNDSLELSSMNHFLEYVVYREPRPRVAASYLAQMLVRGSNPNLRTFFILMKQYCAWLPYQDVHDLVLTQMKAMGVKADDMFCVTLMDGVCYHFGPNAGYQLLNKLKSTYPKEMPLLCYNAIVRRISKRKMTDEAVEQLNDVLVDMKQQRIFPDEKFYNFLVSGRDHEGGKEFCKAVGIGRQMFAGGIRIGAVSPIIPDERDGITKKFRKAPELREWQRLLRKKCHRW